MRKELYDLHLEAGRNAGRESTCGSKRPFDTESAALRAAEAHNYWDGRSHDVEPYPCAFCGHWHLGRAMSVELLRRLASGTRTDSGTAGRRRRARKAA